MFFIEQIEEFSANLRPYTFPNRELPGQSKIRIKQGWSIHKIAARITVCTQRHLS